MTNIKINSNSGIKKLDVDNNHSIYTTNAILSAKPDLISFQGNNKNKKPHLLDRAKAFIAAAFFAANTTACAPLQNNPQQEAASASSTVTSEESHYGNEQSQDYDFVNPLEDHKHAATYITTPHDSIRYIYIPRGGNGEGSADVEIKLDSDDTYASVIKSNFGNINNDNIYPIALDQAKANAALTLEAANNHVGEVIYTDVADIPSDVLLNSPLNPQGRDLSLSLVNSTFEDFAPASDEITMTTFVDQERFIPDNEYVIIDPSWTGGTSDPTGVPIYRSVEEAVLNNYRSTNAERQ